MSHTPVSLHPAALNQQAWQQLTKQVDQHCRDQRIAEHSIAGATVYDFGVDVQGTWETGILLAQVSAAAQLQVSIENSSDGTWVCVSSAQPVSTCLGSQYAGWPVSVEKYFAMASGPARGIRGREPVFQHFQVDASAPTVAVLVLESDSLPDSSVVETLTSDLGLTAEQLFLCVAPTHSLAGTIQIVARSLETALHQWEVQHGPLDAVLSGKGKALLPPLGKKSLDSIGLTNDSIIYSGQVELDVDGDWTALQEVGQQIPSSNSPSFGKRFLQLFQEAGYDFYKLDPRLFSPAVFQLNHISLGQSAQWGVLHTQQLEWADQQSDSDSQH